MGEDSGRRDVEDIQVQQQGNDATIRTEIISVGDRQYEFRFRPTDDGRVSMYASGHRDGEVVAKLPGFCPKQMPRRHA